MYHLPKGVFDILPCDIEPWRCSYLWQYLEDVIRSLTRHYGYLEIRTPLFESAELFTRTIGQQTDIVSKEMYTFEDKGGRLLSLRPEGTASVMRAFIEKNLSEQGALHKFFYIGPMFRYERQQAGRYRQHHQFGAEAIGSNSPFLDAEMIDLLFSFLHKIGLKNLSLQINSLGQLEQRRAYIQAFKDFLQPHLPQLSEESQRRFETNPLRILDSKDPQDKQLLEHAPSIIDFLSDASQAHFSQVLTLLQQRSVPYTINPRLVRGLDYYNDTVFEITSNDIGAQNSLGGGGRYDSLLKQLGGPDLPAFGFGTGLERILQTLLKQQVTLPAAPVTTLLLIPIGPTTVYTQTFLLACRLRDKGVCCEMDLSGRRLKAILRMASDKNIPYVVVIGDQEVETQQVELKEMHTQQVEHLSFTELENRFTACIT